MSGSLIPNAKQQFLDANGNPLAGGFVYYYIPSTTTFKNTYQNAALTILNTNPIVLDSAGECIAYGAGSYRQIVTDVNGNLIWDQPTLGLFSNDASSVIYTPPFTNSVAETVSTKLSENISVKDFGAKGDGTTNDRPAIQAALNALPSTGGLLRIPTGTYLLDATPLTCYNKSNISIIGDGMGATILNGASGNGGGGPGGEHGGFLDFGDYSSSTTVLNNFRLADFSIQGSNSSTTNHMITFAGINGVVVERVEFSKGYNEVLYCSSGGGSTIDRWTVRDCYFHDCIGIFSYGVNTNTLNASNILITGNTFERIQWGMLILGNNVVITNNKFVDINGTGIAVGESNYSAKRSITSCVVSNNTFTGLGARLAGGYSEPRTRGIFVEAEEKAYADGSQDNGIVVNSNTFTASKTSATNSVECITINGGAIVSNNYASGLATTGGNSTFILVQWTASSETTGVNAYPVKVYLNNNVSESYTSGSNIQFGLLVRSVQNTSLYCSNNNFIGTTLGAAFTLTGYGYLPKVFCNGDIFAPTFSLYNLVGNYGPINTQIYGSNENTFYTGTSRDVYGTLAVRDLTGLTTPSVSGNYFFTKNTVATSITQLTVANTQIGTEVTIFFLDANTTIVYNFTKFLLKGGVNYTSTYGSSITFVLASLDANPAWTEKCRS
jgi:hypothetical protein